MNGQRRHRGFVVVAVLALVGFAVLGLQAPRQALLGYLTAYVFFLAPALGSVALLLVHALTGGRWGLVLRPALLAAARTLPVIAVLLVPLLIAAAWLYPWAGPLAAGDPHSAAQRWYLNLSFFRVRGVICMGAWLWLAFAVERRLSQGRDVALSPGFAAGGLVIYAVTVTVAAVDWVMSLVPQWHSAIFGLTIGAAQLLSAMAVAVACVTWRRSAAWPESDRLRDLGTLLMALMLVFGYMAFMDYLTAWIADLPASNAWYLPRLKTGWRWLGGALVVLHLLLPFVILLSARAKRSRAWMRSVACLLLMAQALFAVWIVLPGSWEPSLLAVSAAALAWLGVGGLCVARWFALYREIEATQNGSPSAQTRQSGGAYAAGGPSLDDQSSRDAKRARGRGNDDRIAGTADRPEIAR